VTRALTGGDVAKAMGTTRQVVNKWLRSGTPERLDPPWWRGSLEPRRALLACAATSPSTRGPSRSGERSSGVVPSCAEYHVLVVVVMGR